MMAGDSNSGSTLRSVGAVAAGALTGIVLSVGTDAALEAARVLPPLSEPQQFTTGALLLATTYRTAYGVLGSYMTARLAPRNPMRHVLVLGTLGLIATVAGTIAMWSVGPHWYPIALVVLALPTALAGGWLYQRQT